MICSSPGCGKWPSPMTIPRPRFCPSRGLISYGPDYQALFWRAGDVDKILRGTKPGDIPAEQPTKFELVVNLKTAKALGLEVPLHIQQLADEVIEYGQYLLRCMSPVMACAVERRRFPVGANPTRRALQPEATGAAMEVTKWQAVEQ